MGLAPECESRSRRLELFRQTSYHSSCMISFQSVIFCQKKSCFSVPGAERTRRQAPSLSFVSCFSGHGSCSLENFLRCRSDASAHSLRYRHADEREASELRWFRFQLQIGVILVYMCVKIQMRFFCVSPCGSVLGPFWVHFGSISGPFWVHFGSIRVHFDYCLNNNAFFEGIEFQSTFR